MTPILETLYATPAEGLCFLAIPKLRTGFYTLIGQEDCTMPG
jgi:hypothetical protein